MKKAMRRWLVVFSRDNRRFLEKRWFLGVFGLEVFGEGLVTGALRMVANVSM